MKTATVDRQSTVRVLVALLSLSVACGKKGDPQAPLPRGPNAVSDLAVEQEGDEAVLTFRFPDRLLTGAPLTDLASIEIYRVVNPPPALTAARGAGAASASTSAQTGTGAVRLPGAAERRAATNVRLAEEAFYRASQKIATLSVLEISRLTQGASVVYRDPVSALLAREKEPTPLVYAVVSVRRDGERSPLSNLAALTPEVAPEAPVLLPAIPEEGRVCLEWLAPDKDVLGRPVAVGGYEVYRRILPQEEYESPLNSRPVTETVFIDTTAPYEAPIVYTVRATLATNPKVEGLAAEELAFRYRDIYAPAPPTRLDALSEGSLVRLIWAPVDAPDLAGYVLYRAEGKGAPARLAKEPIVDTFFTDASAQQGKRYRYAVRSIDRAGNESVPSAEAVAEPF